MISTVYYFTFKFILAFIKHLKYSSRYFTNSCVTKTVSRLAYFIFISIFSSQMHLLGVFKVQYLAVLWILKSFIRLRNVKLWILLNVLSIGRSLNSIVSYVCDIVGKYTVGRFWNLGLTINILLCLMGLYMIPFSFHDNNLA